MSGPAMTTRERIAMLEGGIARLHQTINELRDENTGLRTRLADALDQAVTFQARTGAWIDHVMKDDPTDLAERVARFGEESVELQQAFGQSRADAHALVDYVHDRPAGDPGQEMGGALHTLAGLARTAGLDMVECGETELARLSTPHAVAKIRAKRATRHGRGPLPGITPTPKRYVAAPVVKRSHSG